MGYLHQGRALIAMGRTGEARATLEKGPRLAEESEMARLGDRIHAELKKTLLEERQ
jgi:hypothetical protein